MRKFDDEECTMATRKMSSAAKSLMDAAAAVACGDYDLGDISIHVHNARRALDDVIRTVDTALRRYRPR
jgi:hypothetical protein